MPQRSNLFQKVVRVLHQNVAGDAVVEESKMLMDADSGTLREVDVVITTKVAGHQVMVGIEATESVNPVDQRWVDSMLGKHASLPTNKLVLVSESGFTPGARTKAESKSAVPLSPEDLEGDEAVGKIVNKLGTIYIKAITIDPELATVQVQPPDGHPAIEIEVPAKSMLFQGNGTEVSTIGSAIASEFHKRFEQIAEQLDLRNITAPTEKNLTLRTQGDIRVIPGGGEAEGAPKPAYLRQEAEPPVFWAVESIMVKCKALIEVGEIPVAHAKIEPLSKGFSFGEGNLGENSATFVVDESGDRPRGRMILETKDGPLESEINPVSPADEE